MFNDGVIEAVRRAPAGTHDLSALGLGSPQLGRQRQPAGGDRRDDRPVQVSSGGERGALVERLAAAIRATLPNGSDDASGTDQAASRRGHGDRRPHGQPPDPDGARRAAGARGDRRRQAPARGNHRRAGHAVRLSERQAGPGLRSAARRTRQGSGLRRRGIDDSRSRRSRQRPLSVAAFQPVGQESAPVRRTPSRSCASVAPPTAHRVPSRRIQCGRRPDDRARATPEGQVLSAGRPPIPHF